MRILLVMLIASTAFAGDGILWRHDYPTGRKEASEAGKAVCLVVGSENCFYCRKLEAGTLADANVTAMLKKDYVSIKIDGTKEAEIVKALNIQLYPTTVLADTEGNIQAIIKGYVGPDQMREQLRLTVAAIEIASTAKAAVQALRPQALLDIAKQLHDAGRYADTLDVAREVIRSHPNGLEARSAATLVDEIKTNPEKLRTASRQADEKAAVLQLALSESLLKKGDTVAAKACLEQVLRLTPNGAHAEAALVSLTKLKGGTFAMPATFKK